MPNASYSSRYQTYKIMKIKMIKSKVLFLTAAVVMSIVFSCKNEDKLSYKNPDAAIEDRVEDLLSRMTIEEKFGQVFMVPGDLSDGKEKYKDGIFPNEYKTKIQI